MKSGDRILSARIDGEDFAGPSFPIRPAPHGNTGFQEIRTFRIEKPPGSGWRFLVDDEPLDEAPTSPDAWIWRPGFFAGEVTAQLRDSRGSTVGTYLLDVAPDPTKTGRETFERMMVEIWNTDPTLVIGTEPATSQVGVLGPQQDPSVELARLRRFAPDFIRALREIGARPLRALRTRREDIPLHRIRRVDRHSALSVARNPVVAAGLMAGVVPAESASESPHLDVPVLEQTYDCAANRCIAAMTQAVLRRAQALLRTFRAMVEDEASSDTRTALRSRWPERERLLVELSRALMLRTRQPPLCHVTRAEISSAGLNAVAADPLYARAYGLGWRARRPGIAGPLADERMWISPTWEIYERWCFVRLAEMLRSQYPVLAWERVESHPTRATACVRGQSQGQRIELLLQPRIPGGKQVQSHEIWSVSAARVPDLVMTVEDAAGRRFFVLDAKYRQARSAVLDAMASAHLYHDSIRWGDRRSTRSLLLIPAGGGADWLEDPRFQEEQSVGAHVFSPTENIELPRGLAGPLAA